MVGQTTFFCRRCGHSLEFPRQVFCDECGLPLNQTSAAAAPTPRSLALAAGARPILEFGLALIAAASFLLPLISISDQAGAADSLGGAPASMSVIDFVQHADWTRWMPLALIVFGGFAAIGFAAIRALSPERLSPRVTFAGFAVLGAGFAWLLYQWNDSVAGMTSLDPSALSITPGIGLWLGLGAAAVGSFVCLVPAE
jgi:hypothetical protein